MWSRIERLCKRAQKGDSLAANELIREFYAQIYAYLRRLCKNTEDAEDLTQETFTNAWKSIRALKERKKFSPWLHRIAYHLFTDWLRKKENRVWPPDSWWASLPGLDGNQNQKVANEQEARRLWAAVERLDENKRQVIHLHYYQELSLRETAHALSLPKSTVLYRLREALNLLHDEINKNPGEIRSQPEPATLMND